ARVARSWVCCWWFRSFVTMAVDPSARTLSTARRTATMVLRLTSRLRSLLLCRTVAFCAGLLGGPASARAAGDLFLEKGDGGVVWEAEQILSADAGGDANAWSVAASSDGFGGGGYLETAAGTGLATYSGGALVEYAFQVSPQAPAGAAPY